MIMNYNSWVRCWNMNCLDSRCWRGNLIDDYSHRHNRNPNLNGFYRSIHWSMPT